MEPTSGYHPAVEEYLETVLELEESGIPPMRARLVERLGVSAPAVSETVKRLEREGYLVLDERRCLRLTETGRGYANSIMRRHRLAERLLVDILHLPWSEVHDEAGRLEHAISPRLEAHLVRLLGDPGTCPHGNPIPGSANAHDPGPLVPLAEVHAGGTAVVRRIDERLESQYERMRALEDIGVLPGRQLTVTAVDTAQVRLRLDGTDGQVYVPVPVAEKVYVTAA